MSDVELTNVRVTYRLGATIKTGDFTNIKPEFELSADVPDGVSPTVAKDKITRTVEKWLEDKVAETQ